MCRLPESQVFMYPINEIHQENGFEHKLNNDFFSPPIFCQFFAIYLMIFQSFAVPSAHSILKNHHI